MDNWTWYERIIEGYCNDYIFYNIAMSIMEIRHNNGRLVTEEKTDDLEMYQVL